MLSEVTTPKCSLRDQEGYQCFN